MLYNMHFIVLLIAKSFQWNTFLPLSNTNLRLKSLCGWIPCTHRAKVIHIYPDPETPTRDNTITWIPSSEIPKAQIKKHFSWECWDAFWQVCVFVVLMRPLWPISSLQFGSSSYGAPTWSSPCLGVWRARSEGFIRQPSPPQELACPPGIADPPPALSFRPITCITYPMETLQTESLV